MFYQIVSQVIHRILYSRQYFDIFTLNTIEGLNEHMNTFSKVLNSLEIKYFTQGEEWQILRSTSNNQHKLIRKLNRNVIFTRNNTNIINYTYTLDHRD